MCCIYNKLQKVIDKKLKAKGVRKIEEGAHYATYLDNKYTYILLYWGKGANQKNRSIEDDIKNVICPIKINKIPYFLKMFLHKPQQLFKASKKWCKSNYPSFDVKILLYLRELVSKKLYIARARRDKC